MEGGEEVESHLDYFSAILCFRRSKSRLSQKNCFLQEPIFDITTQFV